MRTLRDQAAEVTRAEAPDLHALLDEWEGLPDDLVTSDVLWGWNMGFELLAVRAMLDGASPWDQR